MMRTQTARMLDLLGHAVDRGPKPEVAEVRALVAEVVAAANTRGRATNTRGRAMVSMNDGGARWLCTMAVHVSRRIVAGSGQPGGQRNSSGRLKGAG